MTITMLFQNAFERWIEDTKKRHLVHHLREALAELRRLMTEEGTRKRGLKGARTK